MNVHGYTSTTWEIYSNKIIVCNPPSKNPGLTEEQLTKIAGIQLFSYGTDNPNKRQYLVCGIY